ncbi:MAG: 16S rRNA (guanine(966)-N(2))-methyltransferase RsmD [Melioribacteraceae bacterium]|nr:16S rRNA (guanine(966)-N(2))-methyltransferase RsmD [Melioribacteraceae bacterium]
MRIIAGIYKGRTIKFPKSNLVRPTTDKVKESLFNFLINRVDFEGLVVCDIYAGSGSLGLEALSRGAAQIHFVEKDYHVSKMLQENINSLNAAEECTIFKMDSIRFSKLANHIKYDIIFADPPFFKYDIHEAVKNILQNDFLNDEGMIIVERSIQTQKEDVEAFGIEPFRRIGDSLIFIFTK